MERTGMLLRLHRHDERVLHLLVSGRRYWADTLMQSVTHLGDAFTVVGMVVLLLLAGGELARAGQTAGITLVLSHAWVQLLKRSISRARPQLPHGIESLIAAPDRFSFPSGHAAAALSIALALVPLLGAASALPVIGVALLVGMSRCYLGVHYPGDVLVGWLLALSAYLCVPFALRAITG